MDDGLKEDRSFHVGLYHIDHRLVLCCVPQGHISQASLPEDAILLEQDTGVPCPPLVGLTPLHVSQVIQSHLGGGYFTAP